MGNTKWVKIGGLLKKRRGYLETILKPWVLCNKASIKTDFSIHLFLKYKLIVIFFISFQTMMIKMARVTITEVITSILEMRRHLKVKIISSFFMAEIVNHQKKIFLFQPKNKKISKDIKQLLKHLDMENTKWVKIGGLFKSGTNRNF